MGRIFIDINQAFVNTQQNATFRRNNCTAVPAQYLPLDFPVDFDDPGIPAGMGSEVPYIVAAGEFNSNISQEDADQKALDKIAQFGQSNANIYGTCPVIYYNEYASRLITRNNCNTGYTPGTYLYEVQAGKYSAGTLVAANLAAQAEIDNLGQDKANQMASCTQSVFPFKWIIDETQSYCEVVGSVPCGAPTTYTGGEAFPTVLTLNLGPDLGDVLLDYKAYGIPDKFTIHKLDDTLLLDTGYRGDVDQQATLNNALALRGLPPEPIVGIGNGNLSFFKDFIETQVIVKVWAPIGGTAWDFILNCPQ